MIRMTTPMPVLTGQFLRQGRLQLLEVLGNGAFGTVYRALDVGSLELDKPIYYAVKVQYKSPDMSRQAALNNREFATHLAVSDHPNVLSVYDIICDDTFIYVVLALCPGGDLFGAIIERHLYHKDDSLVKSVFIQLIDALHHCHEKGVYHRDLKPENILCSRDGATLYIADFGLATTKPVSKGLRCGSALYMSPECIGHEKQEGSYSSRESDVWSLGVILVNMITGRAPWTYATAKDPGFRSFLKDDDFLYHVLPISDSVNEILKRIFTLNPRDRITLPELRKAIVDLDTFFMDAEELKEAPDYLQTIAASYATVAPRGPRLPSHVRSVHTGSWFGTDHLSESSSEASNMADSIERVLQHIQLSDPNPSVLCSVDLTDFSHSPANGDESPPVAPIIPDTRPVGNRPNFVIGCESSSDDSDGPITPETHPINPTVVVPDISAELGVPVITPFNLFKEKNRSSPHIQPLAQHIVQ